jgi:hypothetical protein
MLYELEPHAAEQLCRPFVVRVDVGEVAPSPAPVNQRLGGPPTVTKTLQGLEDEDADFVLFREVARSSRVAIDFNKVPSRIWLGIHESAVNLIPRERFVTDVRCFVTLFEKIIQNPISIRPLVNAPQN